MVSVVAQHDLAQPFTDFSGAIMLPMLKLGLDDLKLRDHPPCRRNPPDSEGSAAPELPTEMGEPQKRELLGFSLATPFSVSGGKPPEFDRSRLVRVQFPTEPYQPFPRLREEPLDVGSILKAHKGAPPNRIWAALWSRYDPNPGAPRRVLVMPLVRLLRRRVAAIRVEQLG